MKISIQTAMLITTKKKKMTIETFELEDENDLSNAPDWVKNCVEHGTVIEAPLLVDSLVKYGIFKSKTEARNMMKNKGLSVFSYEGSDEDANGKSKYKRHFRGTSEEDVMKQFNDFLKQMDDKEITNVLKY